MLLELLRPVCRSLVWQLLQGMNAMHQDWTLHRDLKPSNILVMGQGPEHGTLKIADFGLARRAFCPATALHVMLPLAESLRLPAFAVREKGRKKIQVRKG